MRDYYMQVPYTNIVFVANLPGVWTSTGFRFPVRAIRAAKIRAASTLASWGFVCGGVFAFLRDAAGLSQTEVARILGVPLTTIVYWERDDGGASMEITRAAYLLLAELVCRLDHRPPPRDYRLVAHTAYHNRGPFRITPAVPKK